MPAAPVGTPAKEPHRPRRDRSPDTGRARLGWALSLDRAFRRQVTGEFPGPNPALPGRREDLQHHPQRPVRHKGCLPV